MLQTGEPRMHEPAFDIHEEEYIQWDYGKGYIDALADTRPRAGSPDRGHVRARGARRRFETDFRFCPRCGRSLGAVRMYHELVDRGMDEREVRTLLVRAGYEPF